MEVIIQNIAKLPIQKESIEVDINKQSVLFYQAYQPANTLQTGGKMYVYVDFNFEVKTDSNNDVWIIPKDFEIKE